MTTINELKDQKQTKVDQLLNNCLIFFAFSNEQFDKNKTPLQEGEKYVSIGAGGYMPKSKVDAFTKGMKDINNWYKAEVKANKGMRTANILYELNKHEAFYTGEISDTLASLGRGYTAKEVWTVYNANYQFADL